MVWCEGVVGGVVMWLTTLPEHHVVCVCVGNHWRLDTTVIVDTEHKCGPTWSQVASNHFNNNPGINGNFQVCGVNCVSLGSTHKMFQYNRRIVWNFFRLENEHLNNCDQYRVVRDISIRPMNIQEAEQEGAQWGLWFYVNMQQLAEMTHPPNHWDNFIHFN